MPGSGGATHMKKLILLFSLGVVFVIPVLASADHTTAHTIQQLQAQIKALQEQINALSGGTLAASAVSVPAQTPVVVPPTTITTTTPVPPIEPVPPVFDDDTSDDDIIQLNNLRIQKISSTRLPAVINASYDFGITCVKFETDRAEKGMAIPCPASPTTLYEIRVDSDTRLLLRNRGRARITDFEVGDRINVYGFRDGGSGLIDALIVRNLDKPVVKQFIQLNNVEVVSPPSASRPPATLVVAQKGISPCWDFGAGQETKSSTIFPCPLGVRMRETQGISQETPPAYYPRKYVIEVTPRTQILDLTRRSLALDKIQMGDTLNIYGSYTGDSSQISALTIRDLSQSENNRGTLQVTVSGGNIYCIQQGYEQGYEERKNQQLIYPAPPCGIIYDATVEVYNNEGKLVDKKTTARGVAVFENLRFGNYTVVASAPGYDRVKEAVTLGIEKPGPVVSITMTLQKITPPSSNRPPQIIGLPPVPVSIEPGQQVSFSWSATDTDGDDLSWSASWGDGTGMASACRIPLPPSQNKQGWTFTQSHTWSKPGIYVVSVTVSDCRGGSDTNEFKVQVGGVSGNLPPVISGVKGPTALKVGEVGTWTVNANDPENGPLSYSVTWGDETSAVGGGGGIGAPVPLRAEVSQIATFTHSYAVAGVYTPVFTVTDNSGFPAKTSMSVSVGVATPPPINTQSINFTIQEKYEHRGVASLSISDTNGRPVRPVSSREYAPYFSLQAGYYNATLDVIEYRSSGQQPNKTQLTAQFKTDGYNYSIDGSTVRINGVLESEIAGWFFKAFVAINNVQINGAQGRESFNADFVLTDSKGNKVNTVYFTVPPYRIPVGQYTARIGVRSNTSTREETATFLIGATASGYVISEGGNPPPPPPPIASLTVISPNGGEVWQKGTVQTIRWKYNNTLPECPVGAFCVVPALAQVDIFLASWSPPCEKGQVCALAPVFGTFIAKGVTNNGAFEWKVGENLAGSFAPNGNYIISVSAPDSSTKDQSDAPFSITAETQPSVKPMVFKDISELISVIPSNVANLSFGVYQISAQYNLGAYHLGKWYEGLNPGISGPVWVEFGWPNSPDIDVILKDENGLARKIYLPATGSNKNPDGSTSDWFYWIGEDGSSYYAHASHGYGWPNLSSSEALKPEHLARKAGVSTTVVSEQVKCVFKDSTTEQKCYTATDYTSPYYNQGCSGKETCVVDLKGTKGDKITWKSSCGGYAYTTMDGSNEYTEFNCGTTQPFIQVLSPNGGETLKTGETYTIRWNSSNILSSENVKIELGYNHIDSSYSGTYIEEWIVEKTPNTGSYIWKVPEVYGLGLKSSEFSIKISVTGAVDYSDKKFTILMGVSSPTLSVSSPVAGAAYTSGQIVPIKWTPPYGSGESVRFSLLKKTDPSFLNWSALDTYYESSVQSWVWRIPSTLASGDYYLRVETHRNAIPYGIGYSGVFTIKSPTTTQPAVKIIYPVAGSTLTNKSVVVSGTCSNYSGTVDVFYYSDKKEEVFVQCISGKWSTNISINSNAGSGSFDLYAQLYPNNISVQDKIKLYFNWSSTPSITVLSPNGGENWVMNSSQTIKWVSHGTYVTISLVSLDKTKEVYGLLGSIPNDGVETMWLPSDLPLGQFYLRVRCVGNCTASTQQYDDSDAPFSIVAQQTSLVKIVQGATQPPVMLAVRSSIVPFTNITISASENIVLQNLTVERSSGFGNDAAFKEVVLIAHYSGDVPGEDLIVASAKIDPLTHRAILYPKGNMDDFGFRNFTVAGVMADDLANFAGQTDMLSVLGGEFRRANVQGERISVKLEKSIYGAVHTLNNSLSVGTITADIVNRPTAKITLNASLVENVRLEKIVLKNAGGGLYVNGGKLSCTPLFSDSQVCDFGGGNIEKGGYLIIEPFSGSATLIDLSDIVAYGATYGYRLAPRMAQLTTQPSITVLSPNGGEVWKMGQGGHVDEPLSGEFRWSSIGLSNEQIVSILLEGIRPDQSKFYTVIGQAKADAKSVGVVLSKTILPDSALNGFGVGTIKFTARLCVNLASDYQIFVPGYGYFVCGITDTSDSPFSIVGIAQKFSIADITGDEISYREGDLIKLVVKGVESDGTPGTPTEGFNVQVYIKNIATGEQVWPKKTGGNIDANAAFDGAYWVFQATEGLKVGNYEADVAFYCSRDDALCAKLYGRGAQVNQKATFSVGTTAQTSITVLSPNGGEKFTYGQSLNGKWRVDFTTNKSGSFTTFLTDESKGSRLQLGKSTHAFISSSGLTYDMSSYSLTSSIPSGGNYKFLVIYASDDGLDKTEDLSDAPFSIVAASALNEPEKNMASALVSIQHQLDAIAEKIRMLSR